ncbi:hypothetical protein GWK47_018963 [Chionoecetes opilio]|uniref:Uncharacterized protein n=1 Tax=Chionoecetes opilio TaxID=41210 RepID=A0A8J5CJ64_CHIOP|nr:hypothetical protein GWK47_018963 [Chionoecetes opilio]
MKQEGTVLQKNRTMENIPPTQQALPAAHHACKCTRLASGTTCHHHQAQQQTPTAEGCGWTLDAKQVLVPVWSSQPAAAKAVSELVKCCLQKVLRLWREIFMQESQLEMHRTVQLQCEQQNFHSWGDSMFTTNVGYHLLSLTNLVTSQQLFYTPSLEHCQHPNPYFYAALETVHILDLF